MLDLSQTDVVFEDRRILNFMKNNRNIVSHLDWIWPGFDLFQLNNFKPHVDYHQFYTSCYIEVHDPPIH